jgi:hypothetical protein
MEFPDEFDNSNWTIAFIAWLEEIKFSTSCGDLAYGKYMFKFIKSEYLELPIKCVLIVEKTIRKITIFEKYSRIGGYLASVILAECGDLRFNNEGQFSSTSA